MLIRGTVEGMRAVTGEYKVGKKAGQKWHFLSMEVKDYSVGDTCSCQIREDHPNYKNYVEIKGDDHVLLGDKDLTGNEVKLMIKKFSVGEMSVLQQQVVAPQAPQAPKGAQATNGTEKEKLIQYAPTSVVCVRFQVKTVQDLGKPKDDDEA